MNLQKQSRPKHKVSKFLPVLYQILDNKNLNIISWTENGFLIENLKFFKDNILPIHFKHNKYSSFLRQLNKYGFQIKEKEKNTIKFTHPSITQTNKEIYRNKIGKQKTDFHSVQVEMIEMQQQLVQLLQTQAQLKQQIDVSKEIMDHFVKCFQHFSKTAISSIDYCSNYTGLIFRNFNKAVGNAGGDLLLHQITAARLAFPEYFESPIITPISSVNSTPLPFPLQILKELVDIKKNIGK